MSGSFRFRPVRQIDGLASESVRAVGQERDLPGLRAVAADKAVTAHVATRVFATRRRFAAFEHRAAFRREVAAGHQHARREYRRVAAAIESPSAGPMRDNVCLITSWAPEEQAVLDAGSQL